MEVKVYTTPQCPWCKKTKEFLTANKVKFKAIDVSTDTKSAKAMVEKSGQTGVPVIEIDDLVIIGFNEKGLRKALKLK